MRNISCFLLLLIALPAMAEPINGTPPPGTPIAATPNGVPNLADKLIESLYSAPADNAAMPTPPRASMKEPPLPAPPPPVTYTVWGYRWNGQQWVKQDTHTLRTTDLKQAAVYWNQCRNFAGWDARASTPDACIAHVIIHDTTFSNDMNIPRPPKPPLVTFTVWAFKLTDGKWVKDDKFSWTTEDVERGWEYTRNVNAVPGWCAVNNCPPVLPESKRFYEGGLAHGVVPRNYYYHASGGIAWDVYSYRSGAIGYSRAGYPVYSEHGGRTIERPHMTIRIGADAAWHYRHTPHPTNNDP